MRSECRASIVTVVAVGLLVAAGPTLAAMKVVAVTVPMPTAGETQPLRGLTYGGDEWMVRITSIRYEPSSSEGGDTVHTEWTVTATSSRPATQKVILLVTLESDKGKRLDGTSKTLFVKFAEEVQEYTFEMKVERGDWERAKHLRIQATFAVR